MIALDTNLIVRLATGDDAAQVQAALAAVSDQDLWIAKTVVLETEWVLRAAYRLPRATILHVLQTLLGNPRVTCEDRSAVVVALGWFAEGLDLADALHLASSGMASKFVTFDADLAGSAAATGALPQVELLRAIRT